MGEYNTMDEELMKLTVTTLMAAVEEQVGAVKPDHLFRSYKGKRETSKRIACCFNTGCPCDDLKKILNQS